jgi:hypothetical protein
MWEAVSNNMSGGMRNKIWAAIILMGGTWVGLARTVYIHHI